MKRFTVALAATLVLAFLASTAMAASSWTRNMNKTYTMMGMSINATRSTVTTYFPTMGMNATHSFHSPSLNYVRLSSPNFGQSKGNMTGNASALVFAQAVDYKRTLNYRSNVVTMDQTGPNGFPRNLLTATVNASNISHNNATNTMYLLPTSTSLTFGFAANSTFGERFFANMTGGTTGTTNKGITFLALTAGNKTYKDTLPINRWNLGGSNGMANGTSWTFVTVGPSITRVGKIIFNQTNGKAHVWYNDGASGVKHGNYSMLVDSTNRMIGLRYNQGGNSPAGWIFQNATLSKDNMTLVGMNMTGGASLTMAFKTAETGQTYIGKGFDLIGFGFNREANEAAGGNRSAGIIGSVASDTTGKITSGNLSVYNASSLKTLRLATTAANGKVVAYNTVSRASGFGALYTPLDNVTIWNATTGGFRNFGNMTFNVIWSKNKQLGLGIYTKDGMASLMTMFVPAQASFGPTQAAPTFTGSAPSNTPGAKELNATDLNWSDYNAVKGRFGAALSGFTPLNNNIRCFNATVTAGTNTGNYTAFRYEIANWAGPVNTLALYKLYMRGSDNTFRYPAGRWVGNTVRPFSYSPGGASLTDGIWWLSNAAGTAQLGDTVNTGIGGPWYVNFVIKDNGLYDGNATSTRITDPQILGVVVPGSSSSSSTGCVFNPTAGFGLEWLLLLLAPAIGIIRSRIKK